MALIGKAYIILSSVMAAMPMLRQAVPAGLRQSLGKTLYFNAIAGFPDRVFMRETIIPYILERGFQRILSVGVQSYSVEITDRLGSKGAEVWTLDIDPEAQAWGVPGRHIVGDAVTIDEIPEAQGFSCVLFNGVLGYGINEPDTIGQALTALSRILPPNGLLVLGWNTDRIPDPADHPAFAQFERLHDHRLPSRITFPGSTHVYDMLVPAKERAGAASGS